MKTACLLPTCLLVAATLSGCYYVPVTAAASSYHFDKHPGVYMETRPLYGYYEMGGSMATYLVNRGSVDKCAWTQNQPSRLLRAGETWLVSEVQSPGAIGVSNVMPWDPNCVNAKAGYGAAGG